MTASTHSLPHWHTHKHTYMHACVEASSPGPCTLASSHVSITRGCSELVIVSMILSLALSVWYTHMHTVLWHHATHLDWGGGRSEANIALCAEASLSSCSVTLTALIQLSFLLKTHIRVTDVKDGQQYNQVLLLQLPLTGRSPHAEVFPLS